MKLILFIILLFVVYWGVRFAIWLFTIYRQIHKAKKQFDQLNEQWERATGYSNGNSSSRTQASDTTGSRRHTTSTGEVVEDRRTENEINRKIFSKDEGEYVDFEEV